MSWQEELRRLDEELAAGRISADDYRLRRDNVLSSAVNNDPPSAPAAPGQADSTQIIAPVSGPQQIPQAAAPSVPSVPSAPAPQNTADQTQIVGSVGQGGDSERTQAVPQSWTQAPQNTGAERTQFVPGVPPQPVAGGFRPGPNTGSGGFPAQQPPPQFQQQQPQQPWHAPQDTGTPWGGGDFPAGQADTSWVGQGPEPSFETSQSKGGGKKIVAIVAAVVVLAGLGVGGYFLFSGNSDQPTPPVAQSTSAPAPPPKPKDDLEIAKLPGQVKETTDFQRFADVAARKVLTDEENTALTSGNAGASRLEVAGLPSGATAVVLTMKMGSAADAATAVDQLDQLQTKYKLGPYTGTTPPNVNIAQLPSAGDGKSLIRGHYVHGSTIVRVQISGTDSTTAAKEFDEILAAQLSTLPANG